MLSSQFVTFWLYVRMVPFESSASDRPIDRLLAFPPPTCFTNAVIAASQSGLKPSLTIPPVPRPCPQYYYPLPPALEPQIMSATATSCTGFCACAIDCCMRCSSCLSWSGGSAIIVGSSCRLGYKESHWAGSESGGLRLTEPGRLRVHD